MKTTIKSSSNIKKVIFISLFLISSVITSLAQCTTSTDGQNLIVNGDFSSGSSGFTSGYTQHCLSCVGGSGGCGARDAYQTGYSNAGEYCVTNDIYQNFHCCLPNNNGAITHTFTDNSPSADNMAMLVDGNSSLGVDVWCQTVTVQAFTNYYFTTSIATLFDDNNPATLGQIKFRINGAIVGTSIISPGSIGSWTNYTYIWSSGAVAGPISICITNDNTTATGNDFALDDISFTAGCAFGAPGPVPNINSGVASVSLCGNPGGVILNSGVTGTAPEFIWKKDGVVIGGAISSSYTATLTGVYEVCTRETAPPSCYRSDLITVTNNFSVNLGTDATLCAPASATLNSGIVGVGLTYVWKKNGSVISGAIASTYLATTAGTYVVEVTDALCGMRTDDIILASSLTYTPNDASFCAANSTVGLSVTGTGIFNWYATSTGGSILAGGTNTNSFTTPPISATTIYYVEDATLTSYTVGPDRGDIGGGIGSNEDRRDNLYGSGGAGDFYLEFQTLKPNIKINSVIMYGYCNQWTPCNGNVVLSFYTTSNVLLAQSTPYAYSLVGGMGGSPYTMLTVPVNVTLPAAGIYRVSIDGSTTGNSAMWLMKTNMAPVACNPAAYNVPSTFTFVSNKPTWMTCPWTYFYKWNISAPGSCGRVPVQAILNCAAPVEFMSFEAKLTSRNQAGLDWITSHELNVSYFEIERSYDGITFNSIGKIKSSGSNSTVGVYTFADFFETQEIVYYRIAEYDADGNVTYSEVKYVRPIESIQLQIVPNPTKGMIMVSGNIGHGESVSIKIINLLGEIIYDLSEENSGDVYSKTINLENEASGMYYVYLSCRSHKICKKVLKE